ncbi:MAG: hypothetical protein NZ930_03820 [Candidatus Bipolaricaulota bacterium]|nr:hypothetical protein [Candidatus Bipolaricaulota bacterium]MDW8031421.1 hypothetical protein [Candidatus Bipolaricaulota bacterium]
MRSFLIKELGRTIVTDWRVLLRALVGVFIAGGALAVALVLWVGRGPWGENRLIVLFEPGVSSEQIRQVYRHVREWEVISEVLYIMREDPRFAQDGVDPERAPAGYLRVTVRHPVQTAEVQAALRELPGVATVQSYQRGALRELLISHSGAHTAVTLAQGGALLLAWIALGMIMRALIRSWRGELEILYLSGVAPGVVREAFFAVAMVCSGCSGVLALGLVFAIRDVSGVRHWVPELSQPGSWEYLSVLGIGLTLLVGVATGVFGAWAVWKRS